MLLLRPPLQSIRILSSNSHFKKPIIGCQLLTSVSSSERSCCLRRFAAAFQAPRSPLSGSVEGGSLSTDFLNHNIDLFVLLRDREASGGGGDGGGCVGVGRREKKSDAGHQNILDSLRGNTRAFRTAAMNGL